MSEPMYEPMLQDMLRDISDRIHIELLTSEHRLEHYLESEHLYRHLEQLPLTEQERPIVKEFARGVRDAYYRRKVDPHPDVDRPDIPQISAGLLSITSAGLVGAFVGYVVATIADAQDETLVVAGGIAGIVLLADKIYRPLHNTFREWAFDDDVLRLQQRATKQLNNLHRDDVH